MKFHKPGPPEDAILGRLTRAEADALAKAAQTMELHDRNAAHRFIALELLLPDPDYVDRLLSLVRKGALAQDKGFITDVAVGLTTGLVNAASRATWCLECGHLLAHGLPREAAAEGNQLLLLEHLPKDHPMRGDIVKTRAARHADGCSLAGDPAEA